MLSPRLTVPEFFFLIKNISSSGMVHYDRSVPNKPVLSSGRAEINQCIIVNFRRLNNFKKNERDATTSCSLLFLLWQRTVSIKRLFFGNFFSFVGYCPDSATCYHFWYSCD
ncbi:GSCOCT00014187001.2-RA-CDS [Cotesia congregata]|uniref:Uncharacterized protein n=1 Tax=Cotesia congregata TaxID=51543 RepID=S6D9K1_COTCN|nr:GSCOCT00014187001.2-RA-CDS [Cotesia congregata]CCQ71197.1 hypothetical protein BV17-1 [Cotesia congregata]